MNLENKDDKAAIEYAEKHGCTVAAARLLMAQKPAEKPAEGKKLEK